jgi:hypothetical protein
MNRVAFLLTAFLMFSCSWIVPDYNEKKLINKTLPPQVIVNVVPHGSVCATHTNQDGKAFRPVQVWVDFYALTLRPWKIAINDISEKTINPQEFIGVDYKAGVGRHVIRVTVGERTYTRAIYVYKCPDNPKTKIQFPLITE